MNRGNFTVPSTDKVNELKRIQQARDTKKEEILCRFIEESRRRFESLENRVAKIEIMLNSLAYQKGI